MSIDNEISITTKASLIETPLTEWRNDNNVLDFGAILLCTEGEAVIQVNFKEWELNKGGVITLFPNDVVMVAHASEDLNIKMLRYNEALLREASLQLEHTVYSTLREDRCRDDSPEVTAIITNMFNLLNVYFGQEDCTCLTQLVLLQLKAFFIGFHDYIYRHPSAMPEEQGSRRVNELFNTFMMLLETRYKTSRDVSYYAELMNITPKYLNIIVKKKTNHTPKSIINHYVILQLRQQLRTSALSIKQIAWDYHFSDTSFFCRYFKLYSGISPQQYRKKM